MHGKHEGASSCDGLLVMGILDHPGTKKQSWSPDEIHQGSDVWKREWPWGPEDPEAPMEASLVNLDIEDEYGPLYKNGQAIYITTVMHSMCTQPFTFLK